MRNFKDFTRAVAGIASALKGINTVVDDIPVPEPGGGGSTAWTLATTDQTNRYEIPAEYNELLIVGGYKTSSTSRLTSGIFDKTTIDDMLSVGNNNSIFVIGGSMIHTTNEAKNSCCISGTVFAYQSKNYVMFGVGEAGNGYETAPSTISSSNVYFKVYYR